MHVSLDGTDFRIREPQPFGKKWFCHKSKGPGIRYDIGISIVEGDIVSKEVYIHFAKKEITLADKGYNQKNYFKHPTNAAEKRILARHETH